MLRTTIQTCVCTHKKVLNVTTKSSQLETIVSLPVLKKISISLVAEDSSRREVSHDSHYYQKLRGIKARVDFRTCSRISSKDTLSSISFS